MDGLTLYDHVKRHNPNAKVVLYQTWARHIDYSVNGERWYPSRFPSPREMLSDLRYHYWDLAISYIPANSRSERTSDVTVAPVGDAWQKSDQMNGPNLYAEDLYHAGDHGSYLAALVLYGTIYGDNLDGLPPLMGLSEEDAHFLQMVARLAMESAHEE